MNIAFIGLGAMGYPMAGHLSRQQFSVNVYNRNPQKSASWLKEYEGKSFETPRAAAQDADVVCVCVGNDDDVRSVVLGDNGILKALKPGAVLIDHTTTSAELAIELADACNQVDAYFLDAPVSGGQAGAENGCLTTMVGGEPAIYHKVQSVLESYSQKHKLMGATGSGQSTKMVNQICIAGVVQGLSEALHFAQNAGLDTAAVVEVIAKGSAQSWQMDNRAHTMLDNKFDFGFAVDWMRKDLDIVLQEAKRNGSSLPMTALVDQFYAQVQRNGGGRFDTSSLITLLDDK